MFKIILTHFYNNVVKNADGTVTIYAKGKDTAGNEVTVQKKVVSLDLDKPNTPVINSNAGYPILSSYGVRFDGTTTIAYDSRTDIDNYYSLDNGITWNKYSGQFDKTSGTIIAKSVKKSTGLEVSVSKTISVPSDAITSEAYDGDDNTGITYVSGVSMQIDSSMQGKNIRVNWDTTTVGYYITLTFLDENKNVISAVSSNAGYKCDNIYRVPLNTKWISYTNTGPTRCVLYEIQVSNESTFTATNGYMVLNADPTKAIRSPYQMVKLNYFSTSIQRLYRIGTTGDWISYNDQPIKVNQGQTIYAKGIDSYGNVTRIISSYTANVLDAITFEAYDADDNTCITNVSGVYMQIDGSMQGKNIRVNWYTRTRGYYVTLTFLDENRNAIVAGSSNAGNKCDNIYTVPLNAKWILYTNSGPNYCALYEIEAK